MAIIYNKFNDNDNNNNKWERIVCLFVCLFVFYINNKLQYNNNNSFEMEFKYIYIHS